MGIHLPYIETLSILLAFLLLVSASHPASYFVDRPVSSPANPCRVRQECLWPCHLLFQILVLSLKGSHRTSTQYPPRSFAELGGVRILALLGSPVFLVVNQ